MQLKSHGNLYLVLSEEYGLGRNALEIAQLAIYGGIDLLQMREKNKSREMQLQIGLSLRGVCRYHEVIFIANDDPLLAVEIDADGVHLGQEDILIHPLDEVRRLLGRNRLIGLSTHSPEQFAKANETDADYLAYGPVFPTRTKDYNIGTADIQYILKIAAKPVFFIGGVNQSNLETLLQLGTRNIALISDILQAPDVTARARWYKEKLAFKGREE